MARPSKLKREGDYWVANIQGRKHSFGNVKKVSMAKAQQEFAKKLQSIPDTAASAPAKKQKAFTVGNMVDDYLNWLKQTTTIDNYNTRSSTLRNFVAWTLPRTRKLINDMRAIDVLPEDLQAFIEYRRSKRIQAGTLWHDFKGISACWNWASGCKGHPASHLPADHKPFKILACPPKPKKELLANDLMTVEEFDYLMESGKAWGIDELFTVLYETGCRPGELAGSQVKDFDREHRQLVLYKHKNGKRQTSVKPRRVLLPAKSFEIVCRRVDSRPSKDAHIFVGPSLRGLSPKRANVERATPLYPSELKRVEAEKAKCREAGYNDSVPWTTNRIGKVFRSLREEGELREHLVPYSFRHLFISESLRAGVSAMQVSQMTGTSEKMINDHYGHMYMSDLHQLATDLADIRAKRAKKRKAS